MVVWESGDKSAEGFSGIDFENGSNSGTDLISLSLSLTLSLSFEDIHILNMFLSSLLSCFI